ncbi:MAG: hypothetical protein AAGC72_00750 [Planctomycetota bacterium]
MVLPFFLTLAIAVVVLVAVLSYCMSRKGRQLRLLGIVVTLVIVGFIPSCMGVMFVVDSIRFGHFEYASFSDIDDPRSKRYLPEAAIDIEMNRYAQGYQARYKISEEDFDQYLDDLWNRSGQYSSIKRGEYWNDGEAATQQDFDRDFEGVKWELLENAIIHYSPTESDGGGAIYFFDREAGIAMQRTGYW